MDTGRRSVRRQLEDLQEEHEDLVSGLEVLIRRWIEFAKSDYERCEKHRRAYLLGGSQYERADALQYDAQAEEHLEHAHQLAEQAHLLDRFEQLCFFAAWRVERWRLWDAKWQREKAVHAIGVFAYSLGRIAAAAAAKEAA